MTKEIREAIDNNEFINDFDYLDYIREILKKYNLMNELNEVMINNDESSGYIESQKIIVFNPEDVLWNIEDTTIPILHNLISDEERERNHIDNPNYANINNIYNIHHEIQHVKQLRLLKSTNLNLLRNLIAIDYSSEVIDENYFKSFYYKNFHDRFFCEYNAIVTGYIKMLEELKNIDSIKKDLIKSNEIIAKHMLYLYSDIGKSNKRTCPVHNMFRLFYHIVEKCDEHDRNIDLKMNTKRFKDLEKPTKEFDKIKYGLSIKPETYNYISKVAKGKIKTLNLFDEIKTRY